MTSEVVERLEAEIAWFVENSLYGSVSREVAAMRDAAALISCLVAERDQAVALNNRYAYERDKAREERDAAERRSEAHWKPRLEQAERLLAEAVEQAFRDGLAYGGNVENADPDTAWLHSKARSSIGGVNGN